MPTRITLGIKSKISHTTKARLSPIFTARHKGLKSFASLNSKYFDVDYEVHPSPQKS